MKKETTLELKHFGENSFGDPLYHLVINGKRERHVYRLTNSKAGEKISSVQNDSGYHKGLYEKINSLPCAAFPDKLEVQIQPFGLSGRTLAAVSVERKEKKMIIEYDLIIYTKNFSNFVWNPSVFLADLKKEIRKMGFKPLYDFGENCLDEIILGAAYEVACTGTIAKKVDEGFTKWQKAIELTHRKMQQKIKNTSTLLLR